MKNLLIFLLAISCMISCTDNVNSIDRSADRLADQAESYQKDVESLNKSLMQIALSLKNFEELFVAFMKLYMDTSSIEDDQAPSDIEEPLEPDNEQDGDDEYDF